MTNYYVYELENIVNGKKYIGKRKCHCDIEDDKYYKGSGVLLNEAKKEFGAKNFKKTILKTFNTEQEAYDYERFLIEKLRAYDDENYYNVAHGGLGNHKGFVVTQEMIEKSLNTKLKNGTTSEGEKNGMFGRKASLNPKSKRVVMFDYLGDLVKIFDCIREANDYFDKEKAFSYISRQCVNGGGNAYGYIFMFYSDYMEKIKDGTLNEFLDRLTKKLKEKNEKLQKNEEDRHKEIYQIDIETIEVLREFTNMEDVIKSYKELNITSKAIKRNLRHGSNTVLGMSFIFKEEYELLSKEEIWKLYHNKIIGTHRDNKLSKQVRCVNNGLIFKNNEEASKYFGYKNLEVGKVCNGIREYSGRDPVTNEKLFWEYV